MRTKQKIIYWFLLIILHIYLLFFIGLRYRKDLTYFEPINTTQLSSLQQSKQIERKGRLLEQQAQQNETEQQKKLKNRLLQNLGMDEFLRIVVIACIVLLVIGLTLCIICIVRIVLRIQSRNGHFGTKVANQRVHTKFIDQLMEINYKRFVYLFGKGYQDNCVICLQEFYFQSASEGQTKKNQNLQIAKPSIKQQKFTEQQSLPNAFQNKVKNELENVKLTICGHLLHCKCLQEWLKKQLNCPLCRESFQEQNILQWEQKIGIDILSQSQEKKQKGLNIFQKQKNSKNFSQNFLNQKIYNTTLNSLSKNRGTYEDERVQQQQNMIKDGQMPSYDKFLTRAQSQQAALSQSQMHRLIIYWKIMDYHYRNRNRNRNGVEKIQKISFSQADEPVFIRQAIQIRQDQVQQVDFPIQMQMQANQNYQAQVGQNRLAGNRQTELMTEVEPKMRPGKRRIKPKSEKVLTIRLQQIRRNNQNKNDNQNENWGQFD